MGLTILNSGYQELDWPTTLAEFESFVRRWELTEQTAILALALGYYSKRLLGLRLWMVSGRRSREQQSRLRRLYERGVPGIFRPAKESPHFEGIAFDVGADYKLRRDQWERVGEIGEALGLRWGGRFRDYDPVHFDTRTR